MLKGFKHAFGRGMGRTAVSVAAINAGQLGLILGQGLFGLIIAHSQHPRPKGQQVKQALGVVIPLHVNGGDGEELSL